MQCFFIIPGCFASLKPPDYYHNNHYLINRTIANYLGWVVIQKFGPHLSKAFRDVDFKFRRVFKGIKTDTNHWFKCFEVVEEHMYMGIARIYVKATIEEESKSLVSSFATFMGMLV